MSNQTNQFNKDLFINQSGSKSQAIRILYQQGFSRSEISILLQVKYQHVRNVLITPIKNPSKTKSKKELSVQTIQKANSLIKK